MMTTYPKSHTNTVADFDPFSGDTIEKIVPAIASQKEIFASCILGGNDANIAYNESCSLYLSGELNIDILRESVAELHHRHESLRATFTEDGSKMIIYESRSSELHYQDLEALDAALQKKTLENYHDNDAWSGFDLFNGPLTRVALFRLNAETHVLTITAHHIICDGWSFGILLEDLSGLYNAKCQGQPSPEKPLLFSDYVIRFLEYEQSGKYQEVLNYWKKEYEGNVPVFEMPPDFPRPALRTYKSRRDDFILTADIADLIKKTGAKLGSGFVNTLMSAFEILLYKYTGNRDIIIGLPTAGQAATEMYNLIGHCVNFLPLRSNPDPNLSFAEYLKKRKSRTLENYEYQQFTFGTLVKELKIKRDPSRIPLTPISFNIDIGMSKKVAFHDLAYSIVYNKKVAETFEIFLNISDCDNGYVFQWSYNTQLYKPSTIKGLMDKYSCLLQQIVENAEQKIADLRLEDEKVLAAYWESWNNQAKKDVLNGTILDKVNQSCIAHADKTALLFKGGSVSYRELYERSNQVAHYLIAEGVSLGAAVGIAMERSADLIISILGVLKAGGVFVPLDPQYAPERIEYMLENSGAVFLLTSSQFAGKLRTGAREINIQSLYTDLQFFPANLPQVSLTPESLVYILYTSGSTGKPKGVMIANQSLVNYISWAVDYYLKGVPGVFPLYTSISFDLTITSIFSPLVSGSLLKIYDEDDPVVLLEKIFTDDQVNVIKLTPSHLKLVKDSHYIRQNLPGQPLTLIVGGEELETALAKDIYDLCKGNVAICNEYGPTEATVGCMIHDFNPSEIQQAVSIGVPIANARIYLLDEALHLVPKGIRGEIYIGGVCLAKGYYGNELLTRERFLEDPFVPGEKMYKTGDNAIMQDNDLLLFKGRIDDQVKLRGYRIELGEINYHLSAIGGIKNATTIVKEDSPGNGYLVSYIVPQDETVFTKQVKEKWRETLHSKLPDYMIPSVFVVLQELPLTANGKVDHRKLPAPEIEQQKYVAPKTEGEVLLAGIWSEIFDREQIGVYDDFFNLGGHSLMAIKVMTKIEEVAGIRLPIATLFETPTIKGLAKKIAGKTTSHVSRVLVPIKESGTKSPIYLIHGGAFNILLYKQLAPFLSQDQPLYGIQALGLDGDLTHLDSIESIATRYLTEVLEQNPQGPYILMGYSYSGLIAYEMARQLIAMGKEVKMLGILDTNVSNRCVPNATLPRLFFKTKRQLKKAVFIGKNFIQYPKVTFEYQWLLFNRKFNKNFKEGEEEKIYDYSNEVVEAYDRAYNNYKLQPFNITIHLFRVKERIYFLDDFTYLGWKRYAEKGISVYDIEGDHKTFLLPPNNKHLIEMIEKIVTAI
ncbi:MAG: amino acid adenylation domain-containing protein [Niabella sp.]